MRQQGAPRRACARRMRRCAAGASAARSRPAVQVGHPPYAPAASGSATRCTSIADRSSMSGAPVRRRAAHRLREPDMAGPRSVPLASSSSRWSGVPTRCMSRATRRAKETVVADATRVRAGVAQPQPGRRSRAQALAASSSARSASLRFSRSAPASSSSWATLVALAIGALTPGRAISQASATWAGVAPRRRPTASSASRMRRPRASR